jgi:VIT1/CCC1 family predicted Fe2+/Mn2+ transporter
LRSYGAGNHEQRDLTVKEQFMDDATQQRVITLLAAGIAYGISHWVTARYINIPEQRGIKDDVLEATLKGATTAASTIVASLIVWELFKNK